MYDIYYIFLISVLLFCFCIDLYFLKKNKFKEELGFLAININLLALVYLCFTEIKLSFVLIILVNTIFQPIYDKKKNFNIILLDLISLIILIPITILNSKSFQYAESVGKASSIYFILLFVFAILFLLMNIYNMKKFAKISRNQFIFTILFHIIIYAEFIYFYFH